MNTSSIRAKFKTAVVLSFLLQLLICPLPGKSWPLIANSEQNVHFIFSDGFIFISADTDMSKSEAVEIAKIARLAYDFDVLDSQWTNGTQLYGPIQLVFKSQIEARGLTQPVLSKISIKSEYLHDQWLYNILAHELMHMQDFRVIGMPQHNLLPKYILEGRAWLAGAMFRRQLKMPINTIDIEAINVMCQINSETMRILFENPESRGRGYEVGGYLFVDFLRTKLRGKGYTNVQERLAKTIEDMSTGTLFPEAFAKQFNCSLAESQNNFCQFLDATQSHPAERFAGSELEIIYAQSKQWGQSIPIEERLGH